MDLQLILDNNLAPAPAPPRFHGHIAAPPPVGSPLAYSEDVIVNLIIQILTLLMRLGHVNRNDFVFPPEGGHILDEALCIELNLAPSVVSLLRRLPYFSKTSFSECVQIWPGSFMPNYLDPSHLRLSRRILDLPGTNIETTEPVLQPQDVILLFQIEADLGENWILDTQANTIRRYDASSVDTYVSDQPEFPEHEGHYRNKIAFHAPTVLADYIDDLRALKMMPGIIMDYDEIWLTEHWPEAPEVRRRLIEEYGWPDDFRDEDWARDKASVWEEANVLDREEPDLGAIPEM